MELTFTETALTHARQRILSREITNEATLTRFLERMASPAALITGKYLIGAAIHAGLYQFVVEVYEASLGYAMSLASSAITCDAITNDADLTDYLRVSAKVISNGVNPDAVFTDLWVYAGAHGLYETLRSRREHGTRRLEAAVAA